MPFNEQYVFAKVVFNSWRTEFYSQFVHSFQCNYVTVFRLHARAKCHTPWEIASQWPSVHINTHKRFKKMHVYLNCFVRIVLSSLVFIRIFISFFFFRLCVSCWLAFTGDWIEFILEKIVLMRWRCECVAVCFLLNLICTTYTDRVEHFSQITISALFTKQTKCRCSAYFVFWMCLVSNVLGSVGLSRDLFTFSLSFQMVSSPDDASYWKRKGIGALRFLTRWEMQVVSNTSQPEQMNISTSRKNTCNTPESAFLSENSLNACCKISSIFDDGAVHNLNFD